MLKRASAVNPPSSQALIFSITCFPYLINIKEILYQFSATLIAEVFGLISFFVCVCVNKTTAFLQNHLIICCFYIKYMAKDTTVVLTPFLQTWSHHKRRCHT